MTGFNFNSPMCPICGKKVEIFKLVDFIQFGRYTDTRRIGFPLFIDKCDNCNYVSDNFHDDVPASLKNFILSEEYKEIFDQPENELVACHIAKIYIDKHLHKPDKDIGFDCLEVAWLCDDIVGGERKTSPRKINASKTAVQYRLEAIKYFERSTDKNINRFITYKNINIILLDLYRRTAQFGKATKILKEFEDKPEYQNIYNQQKTLIQNRDSIRHKIKYDDNDDDIMEELM